MPRLGEAELAELLVTDTAMSVAAALIGTNGDATAALRIVDASPCSPEREWLKNGIRHAVDALGESLANA